MGLVQVISRRMPEIWIFFEDHSLWWRSRFLPTQEWLCL